MIIKRVSIISGEINTMDLDVTERQLDDWRRGELIQRVMPQLNEVEREFLISGMSEAEQDQFFNEPVQEPVTFNKSEQESEQ